MQDLEFVELLNEAQKSGHTTVFMLQIGGLWDAPFVTGIFESFDLACSYLAKDGRMKNAKIHSDAEDNWYAETEDNWAQIRAYKVITE